MRALDVVGIYLQLRSRLGTGLGAQQQIVVRLVCLSLLRIRSYDDATVKSGLGGAGHDAVEQLRGHAAADTVTDRHLKGELPVAADIYAGQ